jgi:uncharacterized protein
MRMTIIRNHHRLPPLNRRLLASVSSAAPVALCLLLLPLSSGTALAQDTPANEENIRKLLSAINTMAIVDQMSEAMTVQIGTMLAQNANADPRATEIVQEEIAATFREHALEFDDKMVELYANHFSNDEIQGLLEFYQTPLGQRLVEEMPSIGSESMTIGSTWGQEIGMEAYQRAVTRMQEEGVPVP